jgi:cysteinyl-tRNA synthetase
MRVGLIALLLLAPAPDPPPALRVEGTRLVCKDGKEVLLRGVAIADPHSIGKEFRLDHVDLIAREWKANCLRIPVHPGHWKKHGAAAYDTLLDGLIDACGRNRLYAVVDYHGMGNLKTGKADRDKPEYDSSMDLARAFWKHIAARHKDKPWVLYELFNEPSGISWRDLRPLLADLLGIVRASAPEAVVIVPSPDWTFDLRGAAAEPLEGTNLLYAWHVYPNRATAWPEIEKASRGKLPVIVTEWGFDLNGDAVTRGNTDAYALPFLNALEDQRIHWTAWVWHPRWGPPMLDGWDGALTPFGRLARAWLGGDRPRSRVALTEVNDFACWLRKPDLKALGESKFDLCVIDPVRDSGEIPRNDIEHLKWSPGGSKIVLARLSIGEAEDHRPYWQKDWTPGKPDWLGPENREWRGRFKAKYWDDRWQRIVFAALDRIIDQGFDGAWFEVGGAWEYWKDREKDDRAKPRLADFVVRLSQHAKRKRREFAVFVQNSETLLEGADYLAAVDGVAREETYFVKGQQVRGPEIRQSEEHLDRAAKAGKKVLVMEFLKDKAWIDWVYERAKTKGYAASVTVKELDRLVVQPGHEPD